MEADPVNAGRTKDAAQTVQTWHGAAALAQLASVEPLLQATWAPVTAWPAWLSAAARADTGWTPVLLVVQRGDVVVGAAALSVRRRRGVVSVQLLGSGRADHARLPAHDNGACEALADAVVGLLSSYRVWRVRLDQLPPDEALGLALASRLGLRCQSGVGCPVTDVDHDAPLASLLSVNGRKSLRRGTNRLAADGRTTAVSWRSGQDVVRDLPEVQELRRERDHALGRASEMDDQAAQGFHTDVATALAADGRLELLRYEVDGVLAAYALVIADDLPVGQVLRIWDGRVATGYDRYGIGWLADVVVLERAHADRSVHQVDWMRGEQENKQRSATIVVSSIVLRGESARWLRQWDSLCTRVRDNVLTAARRMVPPERRHRLRALLTRR